MDSKTRIIQRNTSSSPPSQAKFIKAKVLLRFYHVYSTYSSFNKRWWTLTSKPLKFERMQCPELNNKFYVATPLPIKAWTCQACVVFRHTAVIFSEPTMSLLKQDLHLRQYLGRSLVGSNNSFSSNILTILFLRPKYKHKVDDGRHGICSVDCRNGMDQCFVGVYPHV